MRGRYRRRSLSSSLFWTTLLVGGTFYGTYRFDWFPIPFLPQTVVAEKEPAAKSEAPAAAPQPPLDGQVHVAASAAGPQSEPPPADADDSTSGGNAHSTKARLLVQRAETPAPKLRANPSTPSSVEPASLDEVEVSRPAFGAPPSKSPQQPSHVIQASSAVVEPQPPAVDPALTVELAKIDRLLETNELLPAHRELSTLYWSKPQWRREIHKRIETTARAIYFDPQPQFLDPYVVKPHNQFAQFAKQYHVPWQYLAKLNHVDPRRIRPGQQLKVIQGPFSAIVELNGYLLTVHAYGYYVRAYSIGIGKDGATPAGKLTVLNKVSNPQYTDPQGHVVAGNDPANPLGKRWIDLGNGYGIHGTIDPSSIGKAESRGCIRMRNEDIEEVYDMLAVGSEVIIRR